MARGEGFSLYDRDGRDSGTVRPYIPPAVPAQPVPDGVNILSVPRCGQADRDRVAERITDAHARGYLTLEEAEARHAAIGQASTGHLLGMLTDDLPPVSRWAGTLTGQSGLPRRPRRSWSARFQARQPFSSVAAGLASVIAGVAPGVFADSMGVAHGTLVALCAVTAIAGTFGLIAAFAAFMTWSAPETGGGS
jgi:Domain of unknown function (DUF1707)